MTTKIFEVFKSTSNLWYFYLKDAEGFVIAVSEGYVERSEVLRIYNTFFPTWEWREAK